MRTSKEIKYYENNQKATAGKVRKELQKTYV